MALLKKLFHEINIDRYGNILHKQITIITENDIQLAETYKRYSYIPGDDLSSADKLIQDYSQIAWTPSVIAAAQARRNIK